MIKINFDDPFTPEAKAEQASGPTLRVTDEAAARLNALVANQNKPNLCLRISVNGGGCGGYSYAFKFIETPEATDLIITHNGAKIVIDTISHNFVKGAVFDYIETIETSQFIIKNPNATSSCGCGNSFSM